MALVKLRDICSKIGSGATPRGGKDVYRQAGVTLIRSQNVRDFSFTMDGLVHISDSDARMLENVEVLPGDVLLNITGDSVARSCIVDDTILPARVNQHVAIIRGKSDVVNNAYILYNLQWRKNELLQMASGGATRNALTKNMIGNLEINLPSLHIQNRIVSIIDALQLKIAMNKKINDNLEEQASLLYSNMFEDNPYSNGNMGVLSDIATVTSGKRPSYKSLSKTKETPYPIVGASSIMGFTTTANHLDKILVIGRVGTHGVVQRFNSPCWTSDNTLVIKSEYYEYMYQVLKRIDYHTLNRGSTQPLITQGDINKVPVLIPDKESITQYEAIAGALMSTCETNRQEAAVLSDIRDTLLPRLMSGELDVSGMNL